MSLLAYSLLVHTMRKTVSAAQVHVAVVCTNQPHTPYLCKPHLFTIMQQKAHMEQMLILSCTFFFELTSLPICNYNLLPCSVWFNSARVGLIVGFVAWFVNYFPHFFVDYDGISL